MLPIKLKDFIKRHKIDWNIFYNNKNPYVLEYIYQDIYILNDISYENLCKDKRKKSIELLFKKINLEKKPLVYIHIIYVLVIMMKY